MITLYGFGRVHPEMLGHGRDLRAQWALEETGLPYRFHALDFTAGELDSSAYGRVSTFHQVPVIDDDGVIVAESGAVVLYLAEKRVSLFPPISSDARKSCNGASPRWPPSNGRFPRSTGSTPAWAARGPPSGGRDWWRMPTAGLRDWSAGSKAASGLPARYSPSPTSC
ncbi:glutathione S-transferase N-terminal domain-containing protein [Mesorhizobium sp. M0768]|uniref:glutathione S-transferase N-terminal domain-containing protein n=1 Tax=Mesorhizobium sp. M0768 TaxID=2956996 RepID=UPI00333C3700